MKFLDLFAGIGGFRLGLEKAGHECVGFCEIDKFARSSYKAIHNTEGEIEWHDITKVSNDDFRLLRGQVDLICGGFPCQAFSVAGKRGGFSDTRGTLFFEIARAVEQIQPRYILLENVKGLLSHDKGRTFGIILNTLDELGYNVEWQVCNSKHFGVPQNRERVYIVGYLRGSSEREIFPIGGIDEQTYTSNVKTSNELKIAMPVLTPDRLKKRQNGRRFKENGEPAFTVTTQDIHGVMIKEATKKGYAIATEGDAINFSVPGSKTRRGRVGKGIANTLDTSCNQGILEGYRIRKLTPRECWRLQGFPDWAFDCAAKVNSDSQLYKQAGNSVTVPVIYEIGKRLK